MVALTKRFIDGLVTPARVALHWDGVLPGFGLRHFPSGVKTFLYDYRDRDGRKRRVTIGRFGSLTVEEARTQARTLAGRVAKGDSPAADRDARRKAPTVGELLDDYVKRHVEVVNAPKTQKGVKAIVERLLRPAFGALKVAGVTRQDVLKLR